LLNEFSEFFGGSQIGLMDDARLAVDAGAFDEVGLLSPITRIPSGYAILKVIPEKEGEKTENVSRARLEAISAYGSVLYSSSVSGLLEAEEALLRFPKVSGWQQDPVLTSLPNGQQFAQRWPAGTDAHDEEDYGADGASGNEVA
jgi:hypothetical protein